MAKKPTKITSNLLSGLAFVSQCQSDNGSPQQVHCQIGNGWITASNGIISAGCKCEDQIEACPQTIKLISALSKCGQDQAITVEPGKITVKSGKFSATVPCYTEPLPAIVPDTSCASISDVLRDGLRVVSHLVEKDAQKVFMASVLLEANVLTATTGHVAIQFWHGIDLPKVALPKLFVTAVCNTDKKLVGFGFSNNSVTFHFEDESWIKTQVFAEEWPDINRMFLNQGNQQPLPEKFYEALRTVEDFADGKEKDQVARFNAKGMRTDNASYEFEGLPEAAFKIKQLKQIESVVETIDFSINPSPFSGKNCRGVIMGVK